MNCNVAFKKSMLSLHYELQTCKTMKVKQRIGNVFRTGGAIAKSEGSTLAPAWMSEAELGEEAGERDGDDHNAAWLCLRVAPKLPLPLAESKSNI